MHDQSRTGVREGRSHEAPCRTPSSSGSATGLIAPRNSSGRSRASGLPLGGPWREGHSQPKPIGRCTAAAPRTPPPLEPPPPECASPPFPLALLTPDTSSACTDSRSARYRKPRSSTVVWIACTSRTAQCHRTKSPAPSPSSGFPEAVRHQADAARYQKGPLRCHRRTRL